MPWHTVRLCQIWIVFIINIEILLVAALCWYIVDKTLPIIANFPPLHDVRDTIPVTWGRKLILNGQYIHNIK